jgi:DNA polymerase III epsilon subunit-like protein
MLEDLVKCNIKEVMAHNASFDYRVLNSTQRYMTKSAFRYWFPKEIEIWDTMKMARDVILKMPTYRKFCEENDILTKTGKLSASAENLYKFIIKDVNFKESHTGLEDVQIEREIFLYCRRQHKKMRKKLWENA